MYIMNSMSSNKRSTDGFEKRKQMKKSAVINSANELFSKFGPEKVSIAEIASHAHVSPVTIYNHFESKEQLIIKLVEHTTKEILARYRKISDGAFSFPEKIDLIFKFKRENATSPGLSWILKASASIPRVREVLFSYFEIETKAEMLKLISEGKSQGYINPELTDSAILIFLDIFMNYYMNNPEIMNRIVGDEELMRQVYSMFWWGLDGKRRDLK